MLKEDVGKERDDRMIGCTTLDIPESYNELHKAVESANVKLANKYDIAIDALCEIAKEDSIAGLIARKALDKIKDK